jgi:thioredoxin-related protein
MVKMKSFLQRFGVGLLILACTACGALAQQSQKLELADDLAALGKLAASRQVPIMLVFTYPVCSYCMRAKAAHLEPMRVSQNYGSKVIMREIETENNALALRDFDGNVTTHGDITRKYDVRSVPTVIVVDAKGKLIADPIIGLADPDFYDLYLEQAIDAGRMHLRQK